MVSLWQLKYLAVEPLIWPGLLCCTEEQTFVSFSCLVPELWEQLGLVAVGWVSLHRVRSVDD